MRKSISLVLTLGILSSSIYPVYSKVDKKLEAEIAQEYSSFKGQPIKGLAIQPSKAVQFVYELQEKLQKTHDKRIAEKIAAIISEGAGVGGIDANRQATEDETKILLKVIYHSSKIYQSSVEDFFNPPLKENNSILQSHYEFIRRAFNVFKQSDVTKQILKDGFENSQFFKRPFEIIEELIKKKADSSKPKKIDKGVSSTNPEEFVRNATVNLLWINKEKDNTRDFILPSIIFRESIEEKTKISIDTFERIKEWATYYPVTIWYDSEFVSTQQIHNTKRCFTELTKQVGHQINVQDIRELETVKEEVKKSQEQDICDAFSIKSPLYFRLDLLRVIAAYESLKKAQNPSAFIYTDFSIVPIKSVFDDTTISNIKENGFVMAKSNPFLIYENSFQIITNLKDELLLAIKKALIDLNITRYNNLDILKLGSSKLDQIVYDSYFNMVQVFRHLQKKAVLIDYKGQEYNPNESLFRWFITDTPKSLYRLPKRYKFKVLDQSIIEKVVTALGEELYEEDFLIIPTKEGNYPKSHFGV